LSIERGLAQSKFGVVVLSRNFFKKEWTQRELDALLLKEETTEKVILPIWHNITEEEVGKFNPLLVDKIGVSTEKSIDYIAQQIVSVVKEKKSDKAAVYINSKKRTKKKPNPQILSALNEEQEKINEERGNIKQVVYILGFIIVAILFITVARVIYITFTEETIENPPEVVLEDCEFRSYEVSCRIFNSFTDKILIKIEIEAILKTPDGDKIVRPQLSFYSSGGQPLQSSICRTEWSYNPKLSNLNSRNMKVTVRKNSLFR
jgi:hypothetical protein